MAGGRERGVTELKAELLEAVKYVDEEGGWYLVTKRGRPVAGLVDLRSFRELWEGASAVQMERLLRAIAAQQDRRARNAKHRQLATEERRRELRSRGRARLR